MTSVFQFWDSELTLVKVQARSECPGCLKAHALFVIRGDSSTGWPNKNYTSFWYFRFIIRTKIKFWSYWRYISSFSQFLTPLSLIKMFKCFLWIMCVPSTHLMLVPIYQTPFWERFRTYPKMKNMLMLVALSQIILQSVL